MGYHCWGEFVARETKAAAFVVAGGSVISSYGSIHMRIRVIALVAAAMMPFAAVSAQQIAGPSNVLSIQPLAAMLTVYAAEYERKTGTAMTLGIGGTYWDAGEGDDLVYTSGDLKLRYYPQGTALQGFAFGGTVGYTSVSATSLIDGSNESANGPSFGVLLEYQWLMGASKNFALTLGAGAKAVMVDEDEFTSNDFIARYPIARVSVGWAF